MLRQRNERGAIIIQVAIALLMLITFNVFVVDYGVMWVSRRQAQNAADAGALAGALSLMSDPGDATLADQTARFFAGQQNGIWGQATPSAHIIIPPLPMTCPPDHGGVDACVRVDVFRGMPDRTGAAHTNTLPTYFGHIVGVGSQGVRATATAIVGAGNSVQCIKPWIVADKWIDNSNSGLNPGGWDQMDTFDPGVDTYTVPGFKADGQDNDFGTQLVLKEGQSQNYTSGWTMQIEFGCPGSNCYRDAIEGCPSFIPTVGLYSPQIPCASKSDAPNPEKGCLDVKPGMAAGPTRGGVTTLVNSDTGASWDPSSNTISGGCMASNTCDISPRVVPIAIFNTAAYVAMDAANACSGGNCRAQVVNLLGFFVEGMCDDVYPVAATRPSYCGTNAEAGKAVVGRLMNYPGQYSGEAGSPGPATFLQSVRLIR